jgi:hypothetical protein
VSLVKDLNPDFSSDVTGDFQAEAEDAGMNALENLDPKAVRDATTDAVENVLTSIGLTEQAEACSDVTTFGGTIGGIAGGIAGVALVPFLGPLALVGMPLLGAASGAATYGASCAAVTGVGSAFKKKEDVYEAVYQTDDGFNTFPLPASVWEDVIAPVLGTSSSPKVGAGSIRPDVAVAMPVELERLQARQAERQAKAGSGSVLAASAVAALLAYKLL